MNKKILSIVLVLSMLVGMLAVMPISVGAATTYEITDKDTWNYFANNVSNYDNVIVNVEGGVLDFGNTAPKQSSGFNGTFDGQGVVIKGVKMSGTSGDIGLFCSLVMFWVL